MIEQEWPDRSIAFRRSTRAHLDLTPMETRVLAHLVLGRSNGEIAPLLNVSVSRIANIVSSILSKTETSCRTGAAIWGYRRGVHLEATDGPTPADLADSLGCVAGRLELIALAADTLAADSRAAAALAIAAMDDLHLLPPQHVDSASARLPKG